MSASGPSGPLVIMCILIVVKFHFDIANLDVYS